MSRRKTDEEYRQTGAFRFFRWLSGSKDAYIDTVEMKPVLVHLGCGNR